MYVLKRDDGLFILLATHIATESGMKPSVANLKRRIQRFIRIYGW